MRIALGIVILGTLLGSTACDSSTDIPGGRYYRSFSFQRTDSVIAERVGYNTGFNTIILNGVFQAPTACQDLKPQIDDEARNLVVTITATAQASCATSAVGHFHYNVVMGSFFPGSYHVDVVHKDAAGTRSVSSQNVTITR